MYARLDSNAVLNTDEAASMLRLTGGHPQLLNFCLELRRERGRLDEHSSLETLARCEAVYQAFVPFRSHTQAAGRLCKWLQQEDLGPFERYSSDALLRDLYWKNLLARRSVDGDDRFYWRCEALRQGGLRVLGCAKEQASGKSSGTGTDQRLQARLTGLRKR